MDILYFLNVRIGFIRRFFNVASAPFFEIKRKIEDKEEPFEPEYSEDSEPAFLDEWSEADESLHVLAYSCVSMLSSALQLYFQSWVRQSRIPVDVTLKKSTFKKQGWLAGYKEHFTQHFQIDFDTAPTNFGILEEIILARNRIEHPSSITSRRTQYSDDDIQKLQNPFFVNEIEASLFMNEDEVRKWVVPPTLHVTDEQLFTAILEIEQFINWFEKRMISVSMPG